MHTATSLEDDVFAKAIYIKSNMWPRRGAAKALRKEVTRSSIHGVVIRTLMPPHFLSGQTGLFAAERFEPFDIVGEYCGEIVTLKGGIYKASLHQKDKSNPISIDAQTYGNECRSINHYDNISEAPNVIMKACYVEGLPRLMIVCKRRIEVNEELLLDYGKGYVKAYFQNDEKKQEQVNHAVEWSELAHGGG